MGFAALMGFLTLINIAGVTAVTNYHPHFKDKNHLVPMVTVEDDEGPSSLSEFIMIDSS